MNNTVHYHVTYGEKRWDIRFSDHFSGREGRTTKALDIIKCSMDIYLFRLRSMQFSVREEHALLYLKSIMLMLPELVTYSDSCMTSVLNLENRVNQLIVNHKKEITKLTKQYESVAEERKLFDSVWAERDAAKTELKKVKGLLTAQEQANNTLKKRYDKLKGKIEFAMAALKDIK